MPSDKTPVLYTCPCGYTSVQPMDLYIDMHLQSVTRMAREKALDVLRESAEQSHKKECTLTACGRHGG